MKHWQIIFVAMIFWTGCRKESDPAQTSKSDPQSHHMHENHAQMPSKAPPTGASIYQLSSIWTDHHGEQHSLSDLSGSPVVIAMVYSHCKHACPRIISDMRRISKALGSAGTVQYVLISIDPNRDTTERLRKFATEVGVDAAGWLLMHGNADAVRELSGALGVSYRKVSESDFVHSNVITVLDAKGIIAHQQQGLGTDPVKTISVLKTLLK